MFTNFPNEKKIEEFISEYFIEKDIIHSFWKIVLLFWKDLSKNLLEYNYFYILILPFLNTGVSFFTILCFMK